MTTKIKILIGVLIVVVILAAGSWWIWGRKLTGVPTKICGPKAWEPEFSPLYCNKSCNTDDDCVYTCGCGAINKDEICPDEGIIYDCVDHEVRCEKGECLLGEEILSAGVTITTDKTEYGQGEKIKTTVFNGLDFSIYADFWKGSWIVLQYQDGQWKEIFYGSQKTLPTCICGKYPGGECPEWEAPQEKFDEIKPSEKVIWVWDQKILKGTDNGCSIWINASPRKYKVKFRHFYTLDPNERRWEKVYSNEFTIK